MRVRIVAGRLREALNLCLSARTRCIFWGIRKESCAGAGCGLSGAGSESNAIYTAYGAVLADIEAPAGGARPLNLRNAPTKLKKELDYGRDYQYAHDVGGGAWRDMGVCRRGLPGGRYYTDE